MKRVILSLKPNTIPQERNDNLWKNVKKNYLFYLLVLPGLAYITVFKILPIFGLVLAFKLYIPWYGFFKSEWIGLANFIDIFTSEDFYLKLKNTLIINSYKLVFGFPAPVVLALLINEIRKSWFKKIAQTVSYFPYFISWIIISGILYNFLNYEYGIVNQVLEGMGLPPVAWYQEPKYWRAIVVLTWIWKSIGYNTVIYLAAIVGIDQQLYEASIVDGANRFRQLIHITIPGIVPAITVMFLLSIGGMISGDFAQIQTFMGNNGALYSSIDIIETYLYRILSGQIDLISYGIAMGMIQSIIAFALLCASNFLAKKYSDYTLW